MYRLVSLVHVSLFFLNHRSKVKRTYFFHSVTKPTEKRWSEMAFQVRNRTIFAYESTKHWNQCAIIENIACSLAIRWFSYRSDYFRFWKIVRTYPRKRNVIFFSFSSLILSRIAILYRFNWSGKPSWWFHHVIQCFFSPSFAIRTGTELDAWPIFPYSIILKIQMKFTKIYPS